MAEIDRLPISNAPMNFLPPPPPGLEALYAVCKRIYPDQPNPLQVAALVKYWLGGPDPLDYISMYANPGDVQLDIPPHWHYISFGLSDLHGDGRVHEITGLENPSGFGFELTFRLRREAGETAPPTWPATLMQSLAKYVFQSGNTLCAGDHVSWHSALDGSESRIQHMLMAADPQLPSTLTPTGPVTFVQVVGVCKEELLAAQRWNGPGVLEILMRLPGAGGAWLVTDMRRGESMLELEPAAQEEVERGVAHDGSNLSGVSARCSWQQMDHFFPTDVYGESDSEDGGGEEGVGGLKEGPATRPLTPHTPDKEQIQAAIRKGSLNTRPVLPPIRAHSNRHSIQNKDDSFETNPYDEDCLRETSELFKTRQLDSLHLTFNLESGILLPLAIRGRVRHGRHFTFKSVLGDTAITLVAASVTGTFVTPERPYAAHGPWLQLLIPDDFVDQMAESMEPLCSPDQLTLPKTFVWPERKLAITIVADGRFHPSLMLP